MSQSVGNERVSMDRAGNGAFGKSDIEGKAAREAASECGQRASFNGASGKRCDIDGVTRTGELAGVSESSRDIDGKAARPIERERKSQARRVSDFTRSRNDSRGRIF